MASTSGSQPVCPVCKQSDQVKTLEAAYEAGVQRCAPPDIPTKNVSMFKYILPCTILVGICIFLVIILLGSNANIGPVFQLLIAGATLISIVTSLVISYIAFQRVVKGDAEAQQHFPAWDNAMKRWRELRYCSRDDVVFDPATNRTLSEQELAELRTMDVEQARIESAPVAN